MSGPDIADEEIVVVDNAIDHRDRANKYLTWFVGIALLFAWTKVTEYRKDRSFLPQEGKVAVYEKEDSADSFQCLDGITSEHGARVCQVIGITYDGVHSDYKKNLDCFNTSFLVSNLIMTERATSADNGFSGEIHQVTECGSFSRWSPGQSIDNWDFNPAKPEQSLFSLVRDYVRKLDHDLRTGAPVLKAPHTKCQTAKLSVRVARSGKANAAPSSKGLMSFWDDLITRTILDAPKGCFTEAEVNKAQVMLKKR